MNLNVAQVDVTNTCAKHRAEISSIETLQSGGTRVVLKTSDAAATIRKVYHTKLLTGQVQRQPTRLDRNR
jgi:hypothetical protein